MKILIKQFLLSSTGLLLTFCTSQKGSIESDKTLFWGDLHNDCNVCYARGSIERAYAIARSNLDFYCFTPHSQWHDQPDNANLSRFTEAYNRVNNDWNKIKKIANDNYKPGEFVSYIGYEWHSSRYGDNCIIMPGSEGELVYPQDIKELQEFARDRNAILIPHHPAYMKGNRGQDWDYLGNKDITPVVEIFSEHGNAESDRGTSPYIRHSMGGRYTRNTIQYLWSTGKQAGIVASSDDHLGYPGGYGEGLAAVYADELNCRVRSYTSRTEAFEERPTNSIILEIKGSPETALNMSLLMPSVMDHNISLKELAESGEIFFTGDNTSESVMIHRVVFIENYFAEFDLKDKSKTNETDFYYVRVIQSNGSLAWSSPIWVNKLEKWKQ